MQTFETMRQHAKVKWEAVYLQNIPLFLSRACWRRSIRKSFYKIVLLKNKFWKNLGYNCFNNLPKIKAIDSHMLNYWPNLAKLIDLVLRFWRTPIRITTSEEPLSKLLRELAMDFQKRKECSRRKNSCCCYLPSQTNSCDPFHALPSKATKKNF